MELIGGTKFGTIMAQTSILNKPDRFGFITDQSITHKRPWRLYEKNQITLGLGGLIREFWQAFYEPNEYQIDPEPCIFDSLVITSFPLMYPTINTQR